MLVLIKHYFYEVQFILIGYLSNWRFFFHIIFVYVFNMIKKKYNFVNSQTINGYYTCKHGC